LWDLQRLNAPPHSLTNLKGDATLAFAPDDGLIATAGSTGDINLRIIAPHGIKISDSPAHPTSSFSTQALAFSPDGKWIAIAGSEDQIQVWKNSGHDKFLENRGKAVKSLAFSADGRWLAGGGFDGSVQLWRWTEEETNPTPVVLSGLKSMTPISSLVFTSQGLLAGSPDGTVRLWELRTDELIKLACQSVGRTLSKKEWATYLLSEPYQENEPCPGLPKAPD
jgi:WD40 repeat protein